MVYEFDSEIFNTNGKVPIQISVDGYEFDHTLLPSKNGHYFVYNEFIRRAVQKELGDTLHIILKKCEENRKLIVPDYITTNLEEYHMLNTFLNQPDYIKREQINYIELAKKEDTKNRRILTLIDKLKD